MSDTRQRWRRGHGTWLTRLLTLTVVGIVSACGSGGGSASPSASSGGGSPKPLDLSTLKLPPEADSVPFTGVQPGSGTGLKLGYISLGDQVPFVHLVSESIKAQADKAGAQLVFCDSREQSATSLDCAKTFKTEGVQAYLNFQSDASAAGAICAAGPQVPVIAIDIHQAPCESSFMGANNHYAGMIGGTAVGAYFKQNFNCQYDAFISMEDFAVGTVNEQRMSGFRDGFSALCGSIHGLKKENTGRIDVARRVFADVLTSMPGAHRIIVVGINDDVIEGALAAARPAGRAGDLFVGGTGADPSALCEIQKNPQWIADPLFFPERYGEIGVPALIAAAKGQSVPKLLLVAHSLVNAGNLGQYYHPTNCG